VLGRGTAGARRSECAAKPKPGRRPLFDIKAMRDDPAGVLEAADAIKAKYGAIFKV